MRIRTVSSSVANVETSDAMLKCNCAANAIAVSLSASNSYPGEINIKKVEGSANAVTITPASGETIDGSSSITLTIENEKKTLIPVDGGWTEVDNINDLPTAAVDLTSAQTLTNKTLTTPVVASFYQDAGKTKLMTTPNTASDTLTAIAATQTLTNKTLTTPVVASVYQDAGKTKLMTVPDTASDTLAAIAAIQTFTNKTLTSPKLNEDVVMSATATQLNKAGTKAATVSRLYNLGAPVIADVDRIVTTTNMIVGTYTVAASPDISRNITVSATAVGAADTMGTITVDGTNYLDAVISEVITPIAGSTVAGLKAFKTVTAVTGAGWVINEGNDTITIGIGNEIGMPIALTATSQIPLAILGVTITAHNPTVTTTVENATIDMSAGTYDGAKSAIVFIVD